jgi:hypothetical protein
VKKRGIGSHTKPNTGTDTIWLTPPSILAVLGEFDLDPCACSEPRPWPTAKRHIAREDDGLKADWSGRVWLNPPYDDSLDLWLMKMAEHRNGMALIFARTETEQWQRWVWPWAHSILFIASRLYFYFPDGTRAAGNAGGPSALIAYSPLDTVVLARGPVSGCLVQRYAQGGR